MFYETKVLDAYGNLKRIVSCKELRKRHWENYKIMEENCSSFSKKYRKKNSVNGNKLKGSSPDSSGDDDTY